MSNIKISSLGGMGENGKNMYLVDIDSKIFILDAGLIYPDIDSYGVDAVVPDIDYLKQNQQRIVGIFLSHGHEDHIGAVPYILENIQCPIYGTNFTISLLEELLKLNNMNLKNYHLYRVKGNKKLTFDKIGVEFIRVNHSLPDSACVVISSPDGKIVYAPDFNFAIALNEKYEVEYQKLLELSKSKVLAVLAESIGISGNNRTYNDDFFTSSIYNTIDKVKGNTYVLCYSTDISRIQQIAEMAVQMEKKIAIVGLKNETIINMAIKTGYLNINPDYYLGDKIDKNGSQLVFVEGTYTEPYYIISKMLKHQFKDFNLTNDDLIITLSNMSALNTKYALSVIDEIYRNDINYINIDKNTFRTSHATGPDLNQLYKITNPKYIIPVKGEERHIIRHIDLVNTIGMGDRVLDINDGKQVEIINGIYKESKTIKTGKVYIDGNQIGSVNEEIMDERNNLGKHGIILVNVYVDTSKREIIKEANIITKGFAYNKLTEENLEAIKKLTHETIDNNLNKKQKNLKEVEQTLKNILERQIARIVKEEVNVLPIIININNK